MKTKTFRASYTFKVDCEVELDAQAMEGDLLDRVLDIADNMVVTEIENAIQKATKDFYLENIAVRAINAINIEEISENGLEPVEKVVNTEYANDR